MFSDMQRRWWMNPTDKDSLRLTLDGLQFILRVLKLDKYSFDLTEEVSNGNLLRLERYFPGPYFLLKRGTFIVFEESEAMMISLHGNDLTRYLDHLEKTN